MTIHSSTVALGSISYTLRDSEKFLDWLFLETKHTLEQSQYKICKAVLRHFYNVHTGVLSNIACSIDQYNIVRDCMMTVIWEKQAQFQISQPKFVREDKSIENKKSFHTIVMLLHVKYLNNEIPESNSLKLPYSQILEGELGIVTEFFAPEFEDPRLAVISSNIQKLHSDAHQESMLEIRKAELKKEIKDINKRLKQIKVSRSNLLYESKQTLEKFDNPS